jgi:hypothetical protein
MRSGCKRLKDSALRCCGVSQAVRRKLERRLTPKGKLLQLAQYAPLAASAKQYADQLQQQEAAVDKESAKEEIIDLNAHLPRSCTHLKKGVQ